MSGHPVQHVYVYCFSKRRSKSQDLRASADEFECEIVKSLISLVPKAKNITPTMKKELLWFNGYFHAWRAIKLYYKAPFTSHLRDYDFTILSHTICQSSFRTKWFSEQPSTHLLRLSKISLCSAILFVSKFGGCVTDKVYFSLKTYRF